MLDARCSMLDLQKDRLIFVPDLWHEEMNCVIDCSMHKSPYRIH